MNVPSPHCAPQPPDTSAPDWVKAIRYQPHGHVLPPAGGVGVSVVPEHVPDDVLPKTSRHVQFVAFDALNVRLILAPAGKMFMYFDEFTYTYDDGPPPLGNDPKLIFVGTVFGVGTAGNVGPPISACTAADEAVVTDVDPAEFVPVTTQVRWLPISAVTGVYVVVVDPGPVALVLPDFHWYVYDVGAVKATPLPLGGCR
jgi:hypothetical protein